MLSISLFKLVLVRVGLGQWTWSTVVNIIKLLKCYPVN